MSKVSVIIPITTSTNSEALTQSIKSIAMALDKVPFEVIIVDNVSIADQSMQITLNQWIEAKLVDVIRWRFKYNPAAMYNYAAKFATGKYLLLTEADVIVPSSAFSSISTALQYVEDKDFGIIGTGIRNINNNEMIFGYDFDFKGEISPIRSCAIGVKKVTAIKSTFMFIDAKLFDKLNGFDENFNENYFDLDLCLRTRQVGLSTIVCSDIIVEHINDNPFPHKRSYQVADYKLFMKKYCSFTSIDNIKKLLVVKLMTLGDCICSIPALKKLRLKYSNYEITLVANKRYADIFKYHNFYDKIIIIDDINREVFNSHLPEYHFYDMVTCEMINSHDYDKVIELNTLCYMGEYKRSGRTLVGHYADLAEVDLTLEEEKPDIRYSQSDMDYVNKLLGVHFGNPDNLYIGLHLFAGWSLKNWGIDNYKKLITTMEASNKSCKYFIFGAPGETLDGFDNVINISSDLSFNQCAYLMTLLDCYVGPDSGFLHMASAMNCPTVGLFGCGNPIVGMSYSDYSIQLLPVKTCETPCLTTSCRKFDGGCTQYIDNVTVAKSIALLNDSRKNKSAPIKIVVIGSNIVIANFINWEWHFTMGAPL